MGWDGGRLEIEGRVDYFHLERKLVIGEAGGQIPREPPLRSSNFALFSFFPQKCNLVSPALNALLFVVVVFFIEMRNWL